MTFSVTPQPDNVPPRVRIDIDSDDPAKSFTSLTIYRDGKKIREQPYIGGSSALAFDYEMPFGVPVTYSATGRTSGYPPVYSTAWSDLSGWTTVSGAPAVAGGRFYAADGWYAEVSRPVPLLAAGRLTISPGLVYNASIELPTADNRLLQVWTDPGGATALVAYGQEGRSVSAGTGPLVLVFDSTGVTVKSTAGTEFIERAATTSPITDLNVSVFGSTARATGIALDEVADEEAFSASALTTLHVDAAWLIHPSQPSLSIPIDFGIGGDRSLRFIEASSGDSRTSNAQSTIHRPVGRRRAIVITSGPRQADEWTLVIGAPTVEAKNAVRAIVDDQTPLLLRFPAGKSQDLPDDWYSVGDVEISRIAPHAIIPMTLITLPLIPVDEPIVRQGALWTWGDVLLKYSTWADVIADNDTWIDVVAGPS
ncbi:hypothetical protein [Aeromicrobium sp. UC242_57]|uniref:hypothetical protein n=1 Tax=Aeromicrobium sp. UC242_57 TaxID=3374624 RepID=UPI0037A6EEF0